MNKTRSRIQSLDGFRAVSIALVLLAHSGGVPNSPIPNEWVTGYLDLGNLGVRTFFVISGFLITGILLREYEERRKIRLTNFYIKRIFRIFPAFYFFMAIISVLTLFRWIPVSGRELLQAWTYTENYQPRYTWGVGQWYIGHTWSLALEEQFYLLWPGVFALWGMEGAKKAAFSFMLIAPLIRIFYAVGVMVVPSLSSNPLFLFFVSNEGHSFETVADALAVGCLLAMLRDSLWAYPLYQKWIRSRFFGLVFLVVIICGVLDGDWLRIYSDSYAFRIFYQFIGVTIANLCIALILDRYMRFPQLPFGRFLNLSWIAFVGVCSYSIYLWQELFLYRHDRIWLGHFPFNFIELVLGLFVCALLSYFLIERPFLKLRERLVLS